MPTKNNKAGTPANLMSYLQSLRPRSKALGVSIAIHLTLFVVFAMVQFSPGVSGAVKSLIPTATVRQIKYLLQSRPVIPKPKVKAIEQDMRSVALPLANADRPQYIMKPYSDGTRPETANPNVVYTATLPIDVEFFGSCATGRKICFVVDCSGSMQGIFPQVGRRLKNSIQNLQQDQYFYIIFFSDNRLIEYTNGRFSRAAAKARAEALEFIDSVQPKGTTNALQALYRAVKIKGPQGASPEIIYFLTDGFELAAENVSSFVNQVENFRKEFAPDAKINTIGFWTQPGDRDILKKIASQSGGQFLLVGPSEN